EREMLVTVVTELAGARPGMEELGTESSRKDSQ
ncbi:phosphoribosylglycinamide formyltransferase, partial [Salmonella enterica subsp. enterica serovar Typhimurium]|nr:phosphoribosylglycinamide formyltransferase [Salmonella enterica subsp. enterica serovar Typhimurium]